MLAAGEPSGDAVAGDGETVSLETAALTAETTFAVRATRATAPEVSVELEQQVTVAVRPEPEPEPEPEVEPEPEPEPE